MRSAKEIFTAKAQRRKEIFLFISFIFVVFICGCNQNIPVAEKTINQFEIRDFNPLSNWHIDSTGKENHNPGVIKAISLDYTEAFGNGFIIPTIRQVAEGEFIFDFSVKNTGTSPQKFSYKIYYQNESYKFPETDEKDSTIQNTNAWENFYGSWEEQGKTFAETEMIPPDNAFHKTTDHFRIVGNPRNEKRYFGEKGNDRWKRNPRVGNYSFLLVVTTPENLQQKQIPAAVTDISLENNGSFVSPWFYFLYGDGKKLKNTVIQRSPQYLKVVARPDPDAGIYINPKFTYDEAFRKNFCKTCGQDSSLYRKASFEQFMHYIDPNTKMNNIPVIADVLHDHYTKMDYNWNSHFYAKEELIAVTATTTKWPCSTVSVDTASHSIAIKNPKTEFGKWEKQDVGIITRHGFTYGKWTVKAKMTELLNKDNLWNGITNAIWLITQSPEEWNIRRNCNNVGYMSNYYGGQKDKRVKNVSYSEIDFEILKTVPYCPSYVLPPPYTWGTDDQRNVLSWNVPFPEEITENDDKIEVACTNWDMACQDPVHFNDGCNTIAYNGQTFWAHRWDKSYRALTEKTPEKDDELFGSEYYYFQIDWEPTAIIWRIGPSKEKLRVVGYVDCTVSSIPNNQMLLIISQEFHNTKWWIGSPYSQDNIPFPKQDIIGKIYELTIE
jgi:hypothetical protein